MGGNEHNFCLAWHLDPLHATNDLLLLVLLVLVIENENPNLGRYYLS